MVKMLAQRIMQILIRNNAVEKKQETLVLFGIEQGLVTVFEIAIMLLTGILLGMFWESVIILLAFIPVRVHSGGYHAKTQNMCIVNSWFLLLLIQLCFKNLKPVFFVQILVMSITGLMIFSLCPIENENRKLKDWEVVKYRRKCRRAYLINICLFFIGYLIKLPLVSKCIMHGMLMLGIMIFLGAIENKRTENG